jgi:hypothetical protein
VIYDIIASVAPNTRKNGHTARRRWLFIHAKIQHLIIFYLTKNQRFSEYHGVFLML